MTIKSRYLLPLIQETVLRLSKVKWFIKLYFYWAYHLIVIAEGEAWKTAFRDRFGLFVYLVMLFGLPNTPTSFQDFINDILRNYLDEFCITYLDDILIYCNSVEQHLIPIQRVLESLKKDGLYLKADKCKFHS